MGVLKLFTGLFKGLFVMHQPHPAARAFMARAQTQTAGDIDVTVAVLDAKESREFFGVPMARRGIQPVWISIVNRSRMPCRLDLVTLNPNYYTPLEAAAANHYSTGKRLLAFGMLAWLFFPLLLLLPIKVVTAWLANRRMNAFFLRQRLPLRPIGPGAQAEGFVFTPFDIGLKVVTVRLLGPAGDRKFTFSVSVPGLDADFLKRQAAFEYAEDQIIACDLPELRGHLSKAPATTSNRTGRRFGDPVNLVVIGSFAQVLAAFGARWDETEGITFGTCMKTFRSFLLKSQYRYSPVSPLYLFGRMQDFALQRIRRSINDRLHLRLWATPFRLEGVPVWIGQVSRDIGVRLTWRTWNLTTHRVNPDIDEAREYVLQDLLEADRVAVAGYVDGVGPADEQSPRRNLTGDPYFTDGKRAVIVASTSATTAAFFDAW